MGASRHLLVAGLAVALTAWLAPAAAAAPELVKLGDFSKPVYVAGPPGDASRVFVVEQGGRIQLLVDGARQPTPFLDVSGETSTGEERGLLSMAFAPDYQSSGRFWVYLTVTAGASTNGTEGQIQVREYRRADPNHAAASPVKRLLAIDHDQADNHNGGQLQTGPDGMLWLGTGDGGGADNSAVPGSAQSTTNLLGKLLRIDPNGSPYGIPSGNPFAGGGGAPEVWAYGLRNPWRFSFDRANGDLVIGDVGQDALEEVDWAPAPGRGAGANYGWPCREGDRANNSCTAPGAVDPTFQKSHTGDGYCAIVGGYVVRDPGLPTLAGRYLYGDNCSPGLRSAPLSNPSADAATGMSLAGLGSFGEDACAHVFATSVSDGGVYRIQDGAPSPCPAGTPGPPAAAAGCGLRTKVYGTRSVTRRRYVRLALRATAACGVTVTGRISGVGRVRTARAQIAAGARRTVRLRVSRRTNAKLRRALRRHRSVRLTLRIASRDASGGERTASRRVRLRRR
jgi:glucose/arabinose dehydrogenase